jgi:hypothetical protein
MGIMIRLSEGENVAIAIANSICNYFFRGWEENVLLGWSMFRKN